VVPWIVEHVKQTAARQSRPLGQSGLINKHKAKSPREIKFLAELAGNTCDVQHARGEPRGWNSGGSFAARKSAW
jgi:hypothetical protein